MNHTLYFKDDALYLKFKRKAKHHGSISDALNEAITMWLGKNKKWPDDLVNMPKIEDDYTFESGRDQLTESKRELF
jgi:hypothetical protein